MEWSFNKFPISVHPEHVEGSCHRTSTSSVRTIPGNENREVIYRQFLTPAWKTAQQMPTARENIFTAKKSFSFPLCALCLCGSNSNLSTRTNPHGCGDFTLKSVSLVFVPPFHQSLPGIWGFMGKARTLSPFASKTLPVPSFSTSSIRIMVFSGM